MIGLPLACLVAHVLDRVPGVLVGLPLVVVASLVFAATRHEDPAAIRRVAIQWVLWIAAVLGGVLLAVAILGWLA